MNAGEIEKQLKSHIVVKTDGSMYLSFDDALAKKLYESGGGNFYSWVIPAGKSLIEVTACPKTGRISAIQIRENV